MTDYIRSIYAQMKYAEAMKFNGWAEACRELLEQEKQRYLRGRS